MEEFKPVFEFDIPLHPVQSPTVPQFEAKHKAFLLCWMWFADQAITKHGEDPETRLSSMSSAADVASDFVDEMYGLDVTARSIEITTVSVGRMPRILESNGVVWLRLRLIRA